MHHFYTVAWDDLFIIFIYSDFNCQHEVIDQEKEAILV